MVKATKHHNQKETPEEIQERISKQMQAGFTWATRPMSVTEIIDGWKGTGKTILVDPDYQRDKVWDNPKSKALNETILRYGGHKIPTLTFRELGKNKYEVIDGKQRIMAIESFIDNRIRLNGVYNPELENLTFEDIKNEYRDVITTFMGTYIQVQIATDMSYDDAVTYFIQINNSGVTMRVGEQIHAMQGTPLVKTIDELNKHPVWQSVKRISRFNDYATTSKMLLFTIDKTENGDTVIVYSNKQLLKELEQFYALNLPKSAVTSVKKTFDVLNKIFDDNNMCVTITEFFSLFLYVNLKLPKLDVEKFGNFISGLYWNLHNTPKGAFKEFKNKHKEIGFNYNTTYYEWYFLAVTRMYNQFQKGSDWNEIKRLDLTF